MRIVRYSMKGILVFALVLVVLMGVGTHTSYAASKVKADDTYPYTSPQLDPILKKFCGSNWITLNQSQGTIGWVTSDGTTDCHEADWNWTGQTLGPFNGGLCSFSTYISGWHVPQPLTHNLTYGLQDDQGNVWYSDPIDQYADNGQWVTVNFEGFSGYVTDATPTRIWMSADNGDKDNSTLISAGGFIENCVPPGGPDYFQREGK